MNGGLTAIYSGTFDPLHQGHLRVARHIAGLEGVDSVWLLPSRQNPLKQGVHNGATDAQRLEMARIGAAGIPGAQACGIELQMPYPSYSYSTLCRLRQDFPDRRFVLVVGSDNWLCFGQWRNWQEIIREFGLLVYPRPGCEQRSAELPANVRWLDGAPMTDVSATRIRQALAEGNDPGQLLSPEILDYIRKNRIYTQI